VVRDDFAAFSDAFLQLRLSVPHSVGRHARWQMVHSVIDANINAVRCDADPLSGRHRRALAPAASAVTPKRNMFLVQRRKQAKGGAALSLRRVPGLVAATPKTRPHYSPPKAMFLWTAQLQAIVAANARRRRLPFAAQRSKKARRALERAALARFAELGIDVRPRMMLLLL
jgi:hypothetical protein